MCGTYHIDYNPQIANILNELKSSSFEIPDFKEFFPGDEAPVIALNRDLKRCTFLMKWGYSLDKTLVFNARSENAYDRKLFKNDIERHRCLIPASFYYEWDKNKTKYKFLLENELMYFAGIYRLYNGKFEFTILTKEASKSVENIHHRMPVIFDKDVADKWLNLSIASSDLIEHSINDLIVFPIN